MVECSQVLGLLWVRGVGEQGRQLAQTEQGLEREVVSTLGTSVYVTVLYLSGEWQPPSQSLLLSESKRLGWEGLAVRLKECKKQKGFVYEKQHWELLCTSQQYST